MHTEALNFAILMKSLFPAYFKHKKVLEIGSQDINGSVRPLFKKCHYTGIDIGPGKGVDYVSNGADWPYCCYDTIVCMEVAEHDQRWRETIQNAKKKLYMGGAFIFSCAGKGRAEHGTKRTEEGSSPYTTDYYENVTPEMLLEELRKGDFAQDWEYSMIGEDQGHGDTYFFGIKRSFDHELNKNFNPNIWVIIKYHLLFFFLQRCKDWKTFFYKMINNFK